MTDVEEIKSKIDIVDFIGQYVTLKKAGSNYKAPCPFHQEKTPSFMVSREKQIFKCFGCGEGGDVIAFLMKQENLEFREALAMLAEKTGVQLEKSKPKQVYEQEKNTKNRLLSINSLAAHAFHKILVEHVYGLEARKYLRVRKLSNEIISKFLIGYAPKKDVITPLLAKRGFSAQEIQQAGSPSMFHHRITFPIFDQIGNVVGFSARALDAADEPKYLNTRETALFHKGRLLYGLHQAKQAIKQAQQAVIVEGQMDVVASHQAGVENVVASSGTALTEDHLTVLARLTPNIVFALDSDEAGLKAATAALELAIKKELNVRLVEFPEGIKDTGELVAQNPDAWSKAVTQALPFVEWLVNRFTKEPPVAVEQKKKVGREVLPFLRRVVDPIERAAYVAMLAKKLAVSERSIEQALQKISAQELPADERKPIISRKASLEATIFGILLRRPQLQKQYGALFGALAQWYNRQRREIELMVDEQYKGFSDEALEQELGELVARLRQRKKEKVKAEFAERIAQAQAAGDRDALKMLLKELTAKI